MNMEQLTALVHNFNCNCYEQYTKVSPLLGNKLDESLLEIERFYYSEFWEERFTRRLGEERLRFDEIELDIIQGTTTCLREDTQFKMFNEDPVQNGISNKGTMIALNVNLDREELNDSHVNNVIMHEFGHRQYNLKEFQTVIKLNKIIIGSPGLFIRNNESLSEKDYPYFTDHNELRLRIVPIVKEMYDNEWTAEEAYELSENLKIDDIKDIFEKDYIICLLNNLL